jgi:hypothetical protein
LLLHPLPLLPSLLPALVAACFQRPGQLQPILTQPLLLLPLLQQTRQSRLVLTARSTFWACGLPQDPGPDLGVQTPAAVAAAGCLQLLVAVYCCAVTGALLCLLLLLNRAVPCPLMPAAKASASCAALVSSLPAPLHLLLPLLLLLLLLLPGVQPCWSRALRLTMRLPAQQVLVDGQQCHLLLPSLAPPLLLLLLGHGGASAGGQ